MAISETATAAANEVPDLTLEQAAVLAELGDQEDALSAVLDAAAWVGWDYQVQSLRDQQQRHSLREALTEALTG